MLKAYLIFFLAIMMSVRQITPAEAQNDAILSVEPSTIEVPLGNRVQLELQVRLGITVDAFDIMVNYDMNRLSLLRWEHGDYLSNLTCTHLIMQPGAFELACNQVGQPGVGGDGVLLVLIFDTIDIGFPDVTITEATFFHSEGFATYPQRQHGVVEVTNAPTYTSTPTITRTPTNTLTPTPSPSSTTTPLPTATSTRRTDLSPPPEFNLTEPNEPDQTGTPYEGEVTETAQPVDGEGTPGITGTQLSSDTPRPGEKQWTTTAILGGGEPSNGGDSDAEFSQSENLIRNLWRMTLWIVLGFAALVAVSSAIIFVKRKRAKGKEEDLLL